MDPDLRAALFEEDDGYGGFEELQDDFISQVDLPSSPRKAFSNLPPFAAVPHRA